MVAEPTSSGPHIPKPLLRWFRFTERVGQRYVEKRNVDLGIRPQMAHYIAGVIDGLMFALGVVLLTAVFYVVIVAVSR